MSRLRRSRTHKAQRDVRRATRTRVNIFSTLLWHRTSTDENLFYPLQARTRDLDQIQLVDLDPKVGHS
jgi:bud site selection protein 20